MESVPISFHSPPEQKWDFFLLQHGHQAHAEAMPLYLTVLLSPRANG